MYIVNTDSSTFEWILKEFDVPYIEKAWKEEAQKAYEKSPLTFGGGSVLGRYLRLMNMAQYRQYTYADTIPLSIKANEIKQSPAQTMGLTDEEAQEKFMELQTKLDAGEISQAEFETMNPLADVKSENEKIYTFDTAASEEAKKLRNEEILKSLTPEEQIEMQRKWGENYTPIQWLSMEQMYQDYEKAFDLNVDSKAVVRQICQVYVKMNEALASSDTNAYRAFSGTYDSLRKSANLTKAQNQDNKMQDLGSVGQLVYLLERKGGVIDQIPWPDEYPQDKIDFCINDMKQYNYNLVTKELGLGNLIESYIEKLEQQQKEQMESNKLDNNDFILSPEDEVRDELTDQEAEEFSKYLENEIEEEARRLAERGAE